MSAEQGLPSSGGGAAMCSPKGVVPVPFSGKHDSYAQRHWMEVSAVISKATTANYIFGHDKIEVLQFIPGLSILFYSDNWALNFTEKLLSGNVLVISDDRTTTNFEHRKTAAHLVLLEKMVMLQ